MHARLIAVVSALVTAVCIEQTAWAAQKKTVVCDGILAEIELETNRSFPTAVVYDHTDESNRHTCVLDFGRVRNWPLRGVCWNGERCVLSGPYYNRIGKTYYMNAWDKAEALIIQNEIGGVPAQTAGVDVAHVRYWPKADIA